MSGLSKSQIANHPLYPSLLSAYIGCRKVGAPQKIVSILEDIARENHPSDGSTEFGADPELDQFMVMESYCEVLYRYKEELSKPLDEARTFLSNIETQLSDLCKVASSSTTAKSRVKIMLEFSNTVWYVHVFLSDWGHTGTHQIRTQHIRIAHSSYNLTLLILLEEIYEISLLNHFPIISQFSCLC